MCMPKCIITLILNGVMITNVTKCKYKNVLCNLTVNEKNYNVRLVYFNRIQKEAFSRAN